MIGIVIVTHGRLAEELRKAMEHVVGPQEQLRTICIGPDDAMDEHRQAIRTHIAEVNGGEGVILLTDMFGGTPSNLAISAMEPGRVDVIAGVNLPMLIKLASVRKVEPLAKAVASAQRAGKKYIHVASDLLADKST